LCGLLWFGLRLEEPDSHMIVDSLTDHVSTKEGHIIPNRVEKKERKLMGGSVSLHAVWLVWSLVFFLASILSFIWTSGDRRVLALTPSDDKATGLLPMSFNHFIPLWPQIILTVVFTLGLGSALLVWKTFNDVGANMLQQRKDKYDLDSNSNSNSSSGEAEK